MSCSSCCRKGRQIALIVVVPESIRPLCAERGADVVLLADEPESKLRPRYRCRPVRTRLAHTSIPRVALARWPFSWSKKNSSEPSADRPKPSSLGSAAQSIEKADGLPDDQSSSIGSGRHVHGGGVWGVRDL
jgi:hypothetical protein